MADGSSVGEALKCAAELVKEIPVYKDAVQPTLQGFGSAIRPSGQIIGETITGAVKMTLAPLRGLVWGWDKIESVVCAELGKRFERKLERLVKPEMTVAGPVLESLRFAGDNETLRDMYVNLLATAMDKETATSAHPSFAEIIKQITSDEAKLIQHLYHVGHVDLSGTAEELPLRMQMLLIEPAKCDFPELIESYLGNLGRLGFIMNMRVVSTHVSNPVGIIARKASRTISYNLSLLAFGNLFCQACLPSEEAK